MDVYSASVALLWTTAMRATTPVKVDGAAHVNLHLYARAEYERRVTAFLESYLVRGESSASAEAVGQ